MALPAGYKTTQQCWAAYPKLPFPDNVGTRGTQQKRAREACVTASMQGKTDPELATGPPILKDYAALWRSAPPWTERPKDNAGLTTRAVSRILDPAGAFGGGKTSGDFVRSQALGWRPVGDSKYVEIENKAVILGGIDALAALGNPVWLHAATQASTLGHLKLHDEDSNGVKLLGILQVAAGQLGQVRPASLTSSAALIRAAITAQGLERAAWVARMARMLGAGIRAQKTRNAVETSVSVGLAVTATALNSTGFGAIVGVPLQLTSAAFGLAAVRTSAEKSRAESLLDRLPIEFEFELQSRANQQQIAVARQQIEATFRTTGIDPGVAAESVRIQNNVKVGVTLGVAVTATLTIYWLMRRL